MLPCYTLKFSGVFFRGYKFRLQVFVFLRIFKFLTTPLQNSSGRLLINYGVVKLFKSGKNLLRVDSISSISKISEAYLEPCQISIMGLFVKIVDGFHP